MECKICDLYDYADSFWKDEICLILPPMINISYLPIRIKGETENSTGRWIHSKLGTGTEYEVVLISTNDHSREKNESIIRHELIHYALSKMNLKNGDEDAAFKVLCELFNADWYKELNELESKIYSTYNGYFLKAVELCQEDTELSNHIGDIVCIMGDKDIVSMDTVGKHLGKANLIIDAIQTLINYRIEKHAGEKI